MFRIKTDIRQYKCETKDKVEKLIRNWVIRPTDLIYDADGKDWAPIGQHPAFVNLFGLLDEQEKNTPDTVVTRRSPYVAADDEDVEEVSDDEVEEASPNDENGSIGPSRAALDVVEEVTQLVDRDKVTSTDDDDDDDRDSDSGSGSDDDEDVVDSEPEAPEEPEVTKMIGRPTVSDSEADDDARKTDVFEQEEIAQSLAETSKPKPPEAPDGVELPTNDGEVTMMTERTLEMLKITDEDEAVDSDSGETEEEGDDEDEEVTGVRERADTGAGDEVSEDSSDEQDDEDVDTDDDEEELEDEEDDDEDEEKETDEAKRKPLPIPRPGTKPKTLESGPKLGRHDLPEELFATNEISSPEVQEQLKRLDELGELEPSDPTLSDDEDTPASGEWPASRLHEDSGVDEAWEEIAEDLRTTEELDDDLPDSLPGDEGDEYDDEGEWGDDDTGDHDVPPADFVSDGYKVALPFPVRPTADDIRLGMPQGRVSRAAKDRTFPLPEPKKLGEIHTRQFNLTKKPPRDQTFVVIAIVVVIIILIAVAVASC